MRRHRLRAHVKRSDQMRQRLPFPSLHPGSRASFIRAALIVFFVSACTPVPRVELTAYTAAYSDVMGATDGVLDVVAPYERAVMRYVGEGSPAQPPELDPENETGG
jgi:hypothetical protein